MFVRGFLGYIVVQQNFTPQQVLGIKEMKVSLTYLALLLDLQLLDEHRLDLLGHHLELGVVVNA